MPGCQAWPSSHAVLTCIWQAQLIKITDPSFNKYTMHLLILDAQKVTIQCSHILTHACGQE